MPRKGFPRARNPSTSNLLSREGGDPSHPPQLSPRRRGPIPPRRTCPREDNRREFILSPSRCPREGGDPSPSPSPRGEPAPAKTVGGNSSSPPPVVLAKAGTHPVPIIPRRTCPREDGRRESIPVPIQGRGPIPVPIPPRRTCPREDGRREFILSPSRCPREGGDPSPSPSSRGEPALAKTVGGNPSSPPPVPIS